MIEFRVAPSFINLSCRFCDNNQEENYLHIQIKDDTDCDERKKTCLRHAVPVNGTVESNINVIEQPKAAAQQLTNHTMDPPKVVEKQSAMQTIDPPKAVEDQKHK